MEKSIEFIELGKSVRTSDSPTFATVKTPKVEATVSNDLVFNASTGTGNVVIIIG